MVNKVYKAPEIAQKPRPRGSKIGIYNILFIFALVLKYDTIMRSYLTDYGATSDPASIDNLAHRVKGLIKKHQ